MVGGQGGTTPTYLAYDGSGSRPLLERDENGFDYGRHQWARGELVETEDGESATRLQASLDPRGSVVKQVGASGDAKYERFGVAAEDTIADATRVRFVAPVFSRLKTTIASNSTWDQEWRFPVVSLSHARPRSTPQRS